MKANAMITDKVRSVLIRKGLIQWGQESQTLVEKIAYTLQTMDRDGVVLFKRSPDQTYALVHCTGSYGSKRVDLIGFNDALLGSVNGRFKEGGAVRVQQRLIKLGVTKSIKIK